MSEQSQMALLLREIESLRRRVEQLETKESGGGGGASDFVGLSDTPANFTGAGDRLVQVNAGASALEYSDHLLADQTNNRLEVLASGSSGTPALAADTVLTVQRNANILDKARLAIISAAVGESILAFGDSADEDVGYIFYRHLNDRMYFGTNGVDRMLIQSNGHVHVNETTLDANDQFSVTADANDRYLSFRSSGFQRRLAMYIGTNGSAGFIASSNTSEDSYILFQESSSHRWAMGNDASDSDKFKINSSGSSPSGGTNRLTIDTSGNVGIGEASPDAKVQVNGDIAIVDGMSAPSAISGYARIYVDSADGDLKVRFGNGTIRTIVVD